MKQILFKFTKVLKNFLIILALFIKVDILSIPKEKELNNKLQVKTGFPTPHPKSINKLLLKSIS